MVRVVILLSVYMQLSFSVWSQDIAFRSFKETGGSVTTGAAGAIAIFSNGDIVVANERYTNFSKKGIQLMRLEAESMLPTINKAYFNDFTVENIHLQVRDDSVYMIAQHNNGGVYKLLFMVFDENLNLLRTSLSDCPESLILYSFLADSDGSFRIHGGQGGTSLEHFIISLSASGTVSWSQSIGPDIFVFGGSSLIEDGVLIIGTGKIISGISRDGKLLWSKNIGDEWLYTQGGAHLKNEAYITRYSYDSTLIYTLRIDKNGNRTGQTAGAFINSPVFTEVLPDGKVITASSSFANDKVTLKLSEFAPQGQFVKNHHIDNVFGATPGGAIGDICKYDSHVDSKGNLYVLGVANRQGFFVLRLKQDLVYGCSYFSSGSLPAPIPEVGSNNYSLSPLSFSWVPYPFTEEAASQYKFFCSGCGSSLIDVLADTNLCLESPTFTLDAKNSGAKYLWSDGSTGRTLSINESGTYWVRLINECDTLVDSVTVNMNIRPQIQLSFSPEEPLPDETIQVVATPDTFTFMNWYAMDTLFMKGASFSWASDQNGVYQFVWEVYDDPSCRARDSISIKISLVDYYFPTAFSPNGNDLNDTWGPVGSGIESYTMRIFNRWGQIVYEGENRKWDGTFKGMAMTSGLYSYIVELIDSDGIRHEHRGTIFLVH